MYAYIIEQRTWQLISKMHLYYPKEENGNPRITFSYIPDYVDNTIISPEQIFYFAIKMEQVSALCIQKEVP